ncbi:hypothetical protein D3C76_776030 [compost metagenome]
MNVGCGDDLVHFVPRGTYETAHAALAFIRLGLGRVADDTGPGRDRLQAAPGFTPQLEQRLAHLGVLEAVGAVDVPAVAGATRAATGFVVGQVVARARVIGLLGFPGDQAVLHVDLPGARAGAVHPVGGAHDLVVLPARAVDVLPVARFLAGLTVAVGELTLLALEEAHLVE